MYVMGKASTMPRRPDSLIGGKDRKENYLQLKVWEVEEEMVRLGYCLWSSVLKTWGSSGGSLPCGCSRLLGGSDGGGRHLHFWETPQESRSQTPKRAPAGWRLIAALRDEWLHGHARLKLTRQLLASTAL